MDQFLNKVGLVLQQVFGLEIGDVSIGGGSVFLFLLMILLLGRALVAYSQEILKNFLKNKTNFTIITIFLLGIFVFFFLKLPFSLLAWVISGAFTIIMRLAWKDHLTIRACILMGISIAILAPSLELIYDQHSRSKKSQTEVYFLLPRYKSINMAVKTAEIRKSMYNVFSKVFDLRGFNVLESIIIYPKSLAEYETVFQISTEADLPLMKKVLAYGMAQKTPVDIVIRSDFRYFKDESLVVLVVYYQAPDGRYERMVDISRDRKRITGKPDDLEWISLLACYHFVELIRDRTIRVGEETFIIADYEERLLRNILAEYQNFIEAQPEVNTALRQEVNQLLTSELEVTYEQTNRLLADYASLKLTGAIDDRVEGARAAVKKKLRIAE